MQSVFVAWRFYIKEKVLLKKYLDECNYFSKENEVRSKPERRFIGSGSGIKNGLKRSDRRKSTLTENMNTINYYD